MNAKEAQGRDVEPYSLTIHLINGQTISIGEVQQSWLEWLHALLSWHGISLEQGFTPIGSIAHIERTVRERRVKERRGRDAPVASTSGGGNVVLFSASRKRRR